jgi:cytochrome c oxidase accessory protein FixG
MLHKTPDHSPLYQKHIPIHTRSVKGRFRNFKTAVLVLAYAVFFLLPWLPWQRQSAADQAVMFDLTTRRFFIFDIVTYPQDIFWLSMLLFIAAAFLFFVTGLIGRAWCGYFCFQTLWSDLFIMIEHWIQGERPARLRLRKQPWNAERILKIGASHFLMILISFWTGMTFAAYFAYAPQFVHDFFTGQAPYVAYFTVILLMTTTYLCGGVAREQVCIYMCPYARFQGVMYEVDTLAVSYDGRRGEGTAGRVAPKAELRTRAEREAQGHGDCIDCGFCVQVCPTGIDIRKGLQYQCISCGLCIDACNSIMDSVGYPRGLIRYDSEANLHSETPARPHLKWKHPIVIGPAIAILVMVAGLAWSIAHRSALEVQVQQVRQPLYVMLSDNKVRNRYTVHIVNKTEHEEVFDIGVRGVPAQALNLGHLPEIRVHAGKDLSFTAKIDLDYEQAGQTHEVTFVVTPKSNPAARITREVHFDGEQEAH